MTNKQKVAIVVPTIRKECYEAWLVKWSDLIKKHDATVVTIYDGKNQRAEIRANGGQPDVKNLLSYSSAVTDLIPKFSPACRNFGFFIIAKYLRDVDVIITLDDDTEPYGDTIQDHLDALNQRVPISWFASVTPYMRGFPYCVRNEAPVKFSHGVWRGVPDLDAPSQLALGENPDVAYYKGPIPKGIFTPICGMNVAFTRDVLPYCYWCPAVDLDGAQRFDDIWMGLFLTKIFSENNWAIVSGYSSVNHKRASNVFKNLKQEVSGLEINEYLWNQVGGDFLSVINNDRGRMFTPEQRTFFRHYEEKRNEWQEIISTLIQ